MSGANSLGRGEPVFCKKCDDAVRIVKRLPGMDIELCPTCFEEYLNR